MGFAAPTLLLAGLSKRGSKDHPLAVAHAMAMVAILAKPIADRNAGSAHKTRAKAIMHGWRH
jgi:hypothetical protein